MRREEIKSLMDPRQSWEAELQRETGEAVRGEIDYLCYCLIVKEGYSAAATHAYFGSRTNDLHARWLVDHKVMDEAARLA